MQGVAQSCLINKAYWTLDILADDASGPQTLARQRPMHTIIERTTDNAMKACLPTLAPCVTRAQDVLYLPRGQLEVS